MKTRFLILALLAMSASLWAASPLTLTVQKDPPGVDGIAYWSFSVQNKSGKPQVVAVEDNALFTTQSYNPIFLAQITGFRGKVSTEGHAYQVMAYDKPTQGVVLKPGDSIELPVLSFRFLPESMVVRFGTYDDGWKVTPVRWAKDKTH